MKDTTRRSHCSGCGSPDLEPFLDLGYSPVADAYAASVDEASTRYRLDVAVCAKCRLVQLLEVLEGQTLFGTGYSFYSSASPPLSAYHEVYARQVLGRHGDLARRGVVEVGCNDGDLLRHFDAYPALGVDPAAGPANAARQRGLEVLVRPFGLAAAADIRDRRGRQGVVFANHVLAHVEDVADVLAGVRHLLHDDGLAFVEVQYLPDLLLNNAFDLVYHEHRNFFSLSSLEQAAVRQGLQVVDAQLTDRQGGSLRAVLATKPRPELRPDGFQKHRVDSIRASEHWLAGFAAYESMQGRAERVRDRLWDLVDDIRGRGLTLAGYGAPAKATTLLNFCQLTGRHIDWVSDTTPAKQGRLIPAVRVPIVAPGERPEPDVYLLLAWNYARQIIRGNPGREWLVPFPAPALL